VRRSPTSLRVPVSVLPGNSRETHLAKRAAEDVQGSLRSGVFVFFVILAFATRSISQKATDRTQHLYEEAKLEEKAGHAGEAIQKYEEIIRLNPTQAYAYNNLGRLYHQQGRLQEAIKPLKRACELDPKLEPPHALLGFVLFQLDDFAGARREFKTASQLDPSDLNVQLFLARSLVELQDLKGAEEILDKLQREDPKNTEALYTLGGVHSILAYRTLSQIQTADPNSYLIEVLLGRFSETKQIYPDAAEHYKRAIERAPDVPDLYYRYAHALWAMGDSENALIQYRHALDRNPYDYRSEWESARILLSNNPQEAFRLASLALQLKADVADALTVRGRALIALQRPKEAIEDLKKAISVDPHDAATHFQLARAYREAGLTQEAQTENAIFERMDKEAHAAKEQQPADRN
jgi:tetratricopeptide (TPR) repeat protein